MVQPRRAPVLRAGQSTLEHHPDAGHEHRRDVEQGLRSPGGAEQRPGRRPSPASTTTTNASSADARNRDTVLSRLVQHFSQISLRNDRMAEPDLLGRAYEYLIEQFADDAGKKGGEFYTPRMVVKLIVELLAPTEGMRICDPTAGSGGMLIDCAHHIERKGGNPLNLTLHGQEKNLGTWAICKMNMLLHGLSRCPNREGRHNPGPQARE